MIHPPWIHRAPGNRPIHGAIYGTDLPVNGSHHLIPLRFVRVGTHEERYDKGVDKKWPLFFATDGPHRIVKYLHRMTPPLVCTIPSHLLKSPIYFSSTHETASCAASASLLSPSGHLPMFCLWAGRALAEQHNTTTVQSQEGN